ncbi:MAG: hypothetical protein ACLFU8_17620, partial [Anaerolineales bacterium]
TGVPHMSQKALSASNMVPQFWQADGPAAPGGGAETVGAEEAGEGEGGGGGVYLCGGGAAAGPGGGAGLMREAPQWVQ